MFYFVVANGTNFKIVESKSDSGYPELLAETSGTIYPARFEDKPTVGEDEVYISSTSFSLDGEVATIHGTLRQKTAEEIAAETKLRLETFIQKYMDEQARLRGYGDENLPPLLSAISYATFSSVPKFQAEGQSFGEWRSLVWAKCYAVMGEVLAGTRPVPTEAELISLLPPLGLA